MAEKKGAKEASGQPVPMQSGTLLRVFLNPRGVFVLPPVGGRNFFEKRVFNTICMQIKLFTIPVGDSGGALQEMNAFLRGNKILEVENKLMGNENGAYWCFCVRSVTQLF